jgi:hypothetical protein
VLNQFSALEQLRLAQGDESVFAQLEKLITILGSTEVKASHRKSLMQVLSRHLGADNVLIMFALVIFYFEWDSWKWQENMQFYSAVKSNYSTVFTLNDEIIVWESHWKYLIQNKTV